MLNLTPSVCHVIELNKRKMVGQAQKSFLYEWALVLKIMGQARAHGLCGP